MFLYAVPYAPIPDISPFLALMPPDRRGRFGGGSGNPGPLFAYGLLSVVLARHFSLSTQDIVYTKAGKPYFPGDAVHFSISHCKTHALCAVADFPVGCDIETQRAVSDRMIQRVLAEHEDAADFFAYWTLKESHIKLVGDMRLPFSAIDFRLDGDQAAGADSYGWVYQDIPACTAAILSAAAFPRPALQIFAAETLFSAIYKNRA